ncbi:hypothetical protein GJ496_005056 [Pomphorhynchus laevis]|nr:hypothetical protein GJ496_005056 [Pomphorhynchus laevis]
MINDCIIPGLFNLEMKLIFAARNSLKSEDIDFHFSLPNYKSAIDNKKACIWQLNSPNNYYKDNNDIISEGESSLFEKLSINTEDRAAVVLSTKHLTVVNPWPCLIDEVRICELFNSYLEPKRLNFEIVLIKNKVNSQIDICGYMLNRRNFDLERPLKVLDHGQPVV